MSHPHRSVVSWLFAASVLASAPSHVPPAAGTPSKAREVVTQGGAPATLTPLERAKAAAAGNVIPPGEAPSGARFEWKLLRQDIGPARGRPAEHRTMEPRP
jgi:hypothetical protein